MLRAFGNVFGRTLYVSGSHARGSDEVWNLGTDKYHPLKTLARAATLSRAGDRVFVGAGHTETITGDSISPGRLGISFNQPDVTVIGLGSGRRRPSFTIAAPTVSDLGVWADGVWLHNLHFSPSVDGLLSCIFVDGGSARLTAISISQSAAAQVQNAIRFSGNAVNAYVTRLKSRQADAGSLAALQCTGATNLEVRDCNISGDYSVACIEVKTGPMVNGLVAGNWLENLNVVDKCIALVSTSTGRISGNRCRIATDTQTSWIDTADCDLYENYGVNVGGETGVLIGTPSA